MSICMRCGGDCTCNRHGKVTEELFYACCGDINYPPDHKGRCMEPIRLLLDEYVERRITEYQNKINRRNK